MILTKKIVLTLSQDQKNLLREYGLLKTSKVKDLKDSKSKCLTFSKDYIELLEKTTIRLTLPDKKEGEHCLEFSNSFFNRFDDIRKIKLKIISSKKIELMFFYNVKPKDLKKQDNRVLAIDLGIRNPVTMVNSITGECLILGREYIGHQKRYSKKIKNYKEKHLKQTGTIRKTRRIRNLISKRKNILADILHKITRNVINYCIENNISTIVIGEIIQTPDSLFPFKKFYSQLSYKGRLEGIRVIKQDESYTSQCSPNSIDVSFDSAQPNNRIKRGLYQDNSEVFNADGVGAYNILRSYFQSNGINKIIPKNGIKQPKVLKVIV